VFGDGSQSRCFTHVNDASTLVGIAAHPEANGEVYKWRTHEVTSWSCERIKQMTVHSPSFSFRTARPTRQVRRLVRAFRITKVNKLIGYEPTVS